MLKVIIFCGSISKRRWRQIKSLQQGDRLEHNVKTDIFHQEINTCYGVRLKFGKMIFRISSGSRKPCPCTICCEMGSPLKGKGKHGGVRVVLLMLQ